MELKKPKYTMVWLAALILLLFLSGCLFLIHKISSQNEATMTSYLHDVTIQRNAVVVQHMESTLEILRGVSTGLSKMNISNEDSYTDILYEVNKGNVFVRMGIIDLSGKADLVDVDGVVYEDIDVSDVPAFQDVLNGTDSISKTLYEEETGEYVNYYMVPVYRDDKMVNILCGVNSGEVFEDLIDVRVFRGEGYFIAVDDEGTVVIPPSDTNPDVQLGASIFSFADMTEDQENYMCDILKTGDSEEFIFSIFGEEGRAVVEPLGANNWSLVSVVSRDTLNTYFNKTALGVGLIVGTGSLLFIFLLIWQIRNTRRHQKNLENLAYDDQLTGLRNYAGFYMEVKSFLKNIKSAEYAVWTMNIKEFTTVNDLFSNENGDRLLKYIADYLKYDDKNGHVASRVGADRFIGVRMYNNKDDLIEFFNDLHSHIKNRDFITEDQRKIDFSMGFYTSGNSDKASTIEEMLNNSNTAEKIAKKKSGSHYEFFTEEMGENLNKEANLEAGARDALNKGELTFVLQPKVSIKGEYRVVSTEVLARWNHPEYGLVSPTTFIPVFEKNGFIVDFDRYIFKKACEWYVGFRKRNKLPLELSINVSRQGLLRIDMVEYYKGIKDEFGIKDGYLELEFTESVIVNDFEVFKEKVIKLQEAGFICSIDDFGAGYSSLNVLKNLPIDVLKLDAMFAKNVDNMKRARIIIANFITLAHKLGMITVAEGIESEDQVKFLMGAKCDLVQGYVFSKAVQVDEFEEYMIKNKGKVIISRK